jgi:class 3 adenylate cyclase/HAMP domain-containing protein
LSAGTLAIASDERKPKVLPFAAVRLRGKLTLAFFVVSSAISVLLALAMHRFIRRQLETDVRQELSSIARIGAAEVELPAYQRLTAQLGDLDEARTQAIELGADYKELYEHLRMVRASEPSIIHYAYLLAPTDDPHSARFVADADVLELEARARAGQPLPTGGISHFAQRYDVSAIPLLERALTACTPELEPDFVRDPDYGVRSISAYIPLTDDDGTVLHDANGHCLGVLGVDITDGKLHAALDQAGTLAIEISVAMIGLALIVSIAMSSVLTRSVSALTAAVERFAAKDFAARTQVRTRDEIGQLGARFNAMAETIQQHHEHLEELVEQRTRELRAQKQRSEELLLNVLPAPIADRLKSGENLIVDRFDNVSVLFADIVGFTTLSTKTTPEQLVTMLNGLFSRFDALAERHGLEKIKTIGDAYMVVAGVPEPRADHALALARMALDMLAAVRDYAAEIGMDLAIRVGAHSGEVVAGVIGQKKFIYDLWGDTVNTASRMESHGVAGRVHVSGAMYEPLRGEFTLEGRGEIDIKGKGPMTTYLLVEPFPSVETRQML